MDMKLRTRIAAALAVAAVLWPALAAAQNAPVAVTVNATANQRAINPLIYGVAWATQSQLQLLNAPLNRAGGDSSSTYNWALNADNPGFNWFFESRTETGGSAPGALIDNFIAANNAAGAQSMVTIPMIGWVANLGANRATLPAYSTTKYGAQCATDPYLPTAGDGLKTDCATDITGNNPLDAYVADSTGNERNWLVHIFTRWGGAARQGPHYYLMDNEPTDWFETHRDVAPIAPHATVTETDVVTYSALVKSVDRNALVAAPEEWGWWALLYSAYDQQWLPLNGFNGSKAPDRTQIMGGLDYMPWLLQQWKKAGHPVDVVSVHYYPQGGEYSSTVTTAMQLLRNQSTRELWDPNYVSQSWQDSVIDLIPQLQSWVSTYYYAGTPIGITEYDWGADAYINGATAQADIFGIFGTQGVSMAARLDAPDPSTPTFKAMQMYRNYDGHLSTFGDTSVSAVVPDPDNLSAFAALRTVDGALTVMAISKVLTGSTALTVSIANFSAGAQATAYQLTAANQIVALPVVAVAGGKIVMSLPPQSITLLVIPKATAAKPR
jgi:hypothetical protein